MYWTGVRVGLRAGLDIAVEKKDTCLCWESKPRKTYRMEVNPREYFKLGLD